MATESAGTQKTDGRSVIIKAPKSEQRNSATYKMEGQGGPAQMRVGIQR